MASTLSPRAVYRIIFFVQPISEKKKRTPHPLQRVNKAWKAIHKLYMTIEGTQPVDCHDSLELALALKGEVDDGDAFKELQKEPACTDVTITACAGHGANSPSKAWAEVYRTHLPCSACTTVETVETQRNPYRKQAINVVVQKFHVSSKNFRKKLTVELQCELKGVARIAGARGATLLLLPEFASEVFGFLDRAHVGSALVANRYLHDLIGQVKRRLPVHHLTCAFVEVLSDAAYSMSVRHFQRDLSYIDVRRFKIPSTAGDEDDCDLKDDCDLIRHYLSNSHVADLRPPRETDFPFAIKMLASLATRNFSVGRVLLDAGTERLSDYRSMDVVFGGMGMSELDLRCGEHSVVELERQQTSSGCRRFKDFAN